MPEEQLFIDYLENAAGFMRKHKERLHDLDRQYKSVFDSDLKKEMQITRFEMKKKQSELNLSILYNIDELRAIRKYFPELLQEYYEDEDIGKILAKKAWILDFSPLPPEDAIEFFQQVKNMRMQVNEARNFLKRWVGTVNADKLTEHYPILRLNKKILGRMRKEEIVEAINELDKNLIKQGWVYLLCEPLVGTLMEKLAEKLSKLQFEENKARSNFESAKGRSSTAEMNAKKDLVPIEAARERCERIMTQIFLANSSYLRTIKSKKHWLSKKGKGSLEKLAESVVPKKIKERVWLNEMQKRLSD